MTMKSLFMFYVVLLLVVMQLSGWSGSNSVIHINHALELDDEESGAIQERALIPRLKYSVTSARKLLQLHDIGGSDGTGSNGGNGGRDSSVKRIWPWTTCTKDRIHINQGPTPPLPSGIPTYTVIIENACYFGNCTISNVHLSCGWFSSARHINPSVFKRIRYDDCLVNNGEPLTAGQALTFQYANTFSYPLRVSSVSC
ncbi:hypothetical protein P3L10_034080 [Capsicum annuum]